MLFIMHCNTRHLVRYLNRTLCITVIGSYVVPNTLILGPV